MLFKFNKSLFVILIYALINVKFLLANNEHDSVVDLDDEKINLDDDSNENELNQDLNKNDIVIEEINYKTPVIEQSKAFLYEHFDDEELFNKKWIKSSATKADSNENKYDGSWNLVSANDRLKGDMSLVMESKARHHAISTKLEKPFKFDGKNLILQYEVQFRNGQECGGAYIKLISAPSGDLSQLNDKTPYTIMFGPDKCGNDFKLHFIFMHKNPKNKTMREIHWSKSSSVNRLDEATKDGKWHLFRLTIRPDNSFEIIMDKRVVGKGSLLTDFNPAVNPPKEIDDPNDVKPEDWDEREKIADPDAVKPDDWDEDEPRKIVDTSATKPADWLDEESENIPDPDATKPSDWDPEMDGEWEPPLIANPKCAKVSGCGTWNSPLIDNPKYRGKWRPPLISNPNYKGKWSPKKILNPDYFEDLTPYKMTTIDAVAFELWTISNDIVFDNVILTSDVDLANYILDSTYQIKKDLIDAETDNWFVKQIKYTNKNPWLWAVYLILFAIPLVLFIGFCCVTPGRKASTEATETKNKTNNEFKQGISGDEVNPMDINQAQKPVNKNVEPEVHEEKEEKRDQAVDETEIEELEDDDMEPQVQEVHDDDEEAEEQEEEIEKEEDEDDAAKPRLRKHRARKEN